MIKINDGVTSRALEQARSYQDKLGNIVLITHKRDKEEIFYETTVEGTQDTLVITGGLTSGYGGEGPRGLYTFLKEIGVPDDVAHEKVYSNTDEKFSFTIKP